MTKNIKEIKVRINKLGTFMEGESLNSCDVKMIFWINSNIFIKN